MLLFGLCDAEFVKGSRLQKSHVGRLLPLSMMTFQVNTKNWTTTFLPRIISVYYLLHCSGRYLYNSVNQAKIKQKTTQAFPLHTQVSIYTKYTEYRVWKCFALFSSHFWMCFMSVQGKVQGMQQLPLV